MAIPQPQGRKSGGSQKLGRNKKKCERYHAENRRVKNKRRKMKRLEKKYAKNKARRSLFDAKA